MTHVVYLVAPSHRLTCMDAVAEHFQGSDAVTDIGIAVEHAADKQELTRSQVDYGRIDVAPDLSPSGVRVDKASATGADEASDTTLDELRDRYGQPFLTPFVVADERYDNHPRQIWEALVRRGFEFFEAIFEEWSPSVVVTPNVSRPLEWIPAHVATTDGTYFWWKTTRVGSRYGIIEGSPLEQFCGFDAFDRVRSGEGAPSPQATEQARAYIENVRESGIRPEFFARRADSYGSDWGSIVFPHGLPGIFEVPTLLRNRLVDGEIGLEDRRLPRAKNVWRRVQTHFEARFEPPRESDSFVFFPLHAQPEPSTRIEAPLFEDQVTLVRQVARSLPVDCWIYVKDHPRMWRDNSRPASYYRELSSIPGVRVLEPHTDSHALIRESRAVVSVSGTPAFEAAFFETRSVVFGTPHFTALPCVRRCNSIQELSSTLSWALTDGNWDHETVNEYLAVVFEHSVPIESAGSSQTAQRQIADAVAPELLRRIRDVEPV